MRCGIGWDAHKLVEGRALILGGVDIPYAKGLLGHSDADVLCHAIADALLGAAALGDIGGHFPDNDDTYKGISSLLLLQKTAQLLADAGYEVENIDAVVIAQEPRLAPYIEQMAENIAKALGIAPLCVGVKATTSEYMGFCGRGEGIAAQAIALLKKVK